jgi:protein O-mannosyl-transferase
MTEATSKSGAAADCNHLCRRSEEPLPAWDRRTWLVAIPVAILVIAAFIPTLRNGFVAWDDDKNFLDNPHFQGLGAAHVKWAWSTFWLGVYQPLAWLLFEAQYVVWKLDPFGYHLTSLLLHAVNAVVLFVLTVSLLVRCPDDSLRKSPWACSLGAGLATALFAVHPLRVEAVAWVSCQPYLPCALFSMLAVLAYLRAFRPGSSPRWGWLAGSFVLFVAALLFHAVAMSLPAVLLILDIYPLRRFGDGHKRWFGSPARKVWWEKVPFVIASLAFIGIAIAARRRSFVSVENYHASASIAQACYGIWFYILKTVLPLDLIALNPLPREISLLAPPFLFSILGTLAMSAGLFLVRRRWPGLLAVWLSYLVILAPNSGIVRIGGQIAADRYSYMSMVGWVILAAACLGRSWQTPWRANPGAIGIITLCLGALVGLVPMTWGQCRTWRDSETLWGHALNRGPGNAWLAHNNLGVVLYRQKRFEEAAAHYAEALRLNPVYIDAYNNLARVLSRQGKNEAAAAIYAAALRLDPGHVDAHDELGVVLFRQGKLEEATAHFTAAARLDPGDAGARVNLGLVLSRQGKLEEAAARFAAALRLDPGHVAAHTNLGVVLSRQGKLEEAAAQYAAALRLNPGDADARHNLAGVLVRQGRLEDAMSQYAAALQLDPGHVAAHTNLGVVLSRQGKLEDAAAHYTEALRLDPGHVTAHTNLGVVLSRQGKLAAAVAHCAEALRLNPDYADAHNNLGAILSRQGKYEAAVAHYAEALRLNPSGGEAYNNRAMIMAACPESRYRDGKRALESATRACELSAWKRPEFLGTLAAAYAEAGDFDAAITWQTTAIELLHDEMERGAYRSRLALYQAKKPYREPSPERAPTEVRN